MARRVCQIVECLSVSKGGPSVSVPSLADALIPQGIQSELLTQRTRDGGPENIPTIAASTVIPLSKHSAYLCGYSLRVQQELKQMCARVDLIHVHGLWSPICCFARRAAARQNIPLVVSPRGMLDPWSMSKKSLKKKIAWYLYASGNFSYSKLIHVTSDQELTGLIPFGLAKPVAVIPNGIELPRHNSYSSDVLIRRLPELQGKQCLLFMSRLHEKKGLDILLPAWQRIHPEFPNWHLILAGPEGDISEKQLKINLQSLGIESSTSITGLLTGEDKEAAFAASALFVLPSRSENFGIVIGEALARAIPVIVSEATPWGEVEERDCGRRIKLDVNTLVASLSELMKLEDSQRRSMGIRGRELIREEYSWSGVAEKMALSYEWILGSSGTPNWIIKDIPLTK